MVASSGERDEFYRLPIQKNLLTYIDALFTYAKSLKHAIRLEYFDNAFVNSIAKIAKQKKIIDLTCVTF